MYVIIRVFYFGLHEGFMKTYICIILFDKFSPFLGNFKCLSL